MTIVNKGGGRLTPSLPTSLPSASIQTSEKVKVTDKEAIAEGFDKFFSTARTKLADKISGQKARSGAPIEHTFSVSSGLTQKQFRKLFNTFKQGFCEK